MNFQHRAKSVVFGLVLGLLTVGCNSEADTGQITGRVRHPDGSPLEFGNVTFTAADGKTKTSATISATGEYRIAKIPVGSARITVERHPRVPPGLQIPSPSKPNPPPAPIEIQTPYQVTKGAQEHDIELPVSK